MYATVCVLFMLTFEFNELGATDN